MKDLKKKIMAEIAKDSPEMTEVVSDNDNMLRRKSRAITSEIYEQMIKELDGLEPPRDCSQIFNEEYRRRVCQLPDEDLLVIIETYENRMFGRTHDTIEAVRQELAERGLLKD